jgi:VWFA-related protein
MRSPLLARTSSVAAVTLSLLSCIAAAAQDNAPQTPRFGERIEVREVLLDALVTDGQGRVIVGLDKNDFVVRENGTPVSLSGVTFYSNRHLVAGSEMLAQKGVRLDQVPEDRYFILFFHDQRFHAADAPVLLSQQVQAGRYAKQWVEREVLPNDWVAVVSYDVKLKVYQDFTHDQAALTAAIDDAVSNKDVENNWPSRLPAPGAGPTLLGGLPRGNELRSRTPTVYEGLQLLARSAGNIPARKNLILFTTGFGQLSTAPYPQYTPDPRYYPPTMQALNSNNVAVYPVDLWPAGQVQHTLADAMNQLAAETGGTYVYNETNFLTALEKISTENNGYYLLSYRSEHPAGSTGFQGVDVKTVNPEFRVKVRKGYEYTPGPAAASPPPN